MMHTKRWFIAVAAISGFLAVGTLAAVGADEDSLIVAEDMLIDEAVAGDLEVVAETAVEEKGAETTASGAPAEPLLAAEEISFDTGGTEAAPAPADDTVEMLAVEALGEAEVPSLAAKGEDAEAVNLDATVEGLMSEAAPEETSEPAEAEVEQPVAAMEIVEEISEEPVAEMPVAPETTSDDGSSVDALVSEALGAEAGLEPAPMAPVAAAEESMPVEAAAAEEIIEETPAAVAAPAADTGGGLLNGLLVEDLGIAPSSSESVPAAAAEPLVEAAPAMEAPVELTVDALAVDALGSEPVAAPLPAPMETEALEIQEAPVAESLPVANLDTLVEGQFVEPAAQGVTTPPTSRKPPGYEAPKRAQASGPAAAGAEPRLDSRLSREIIQMNEREAMKRRAYEMHALEQLQRARQALKAKRFEEAFRLYEETLSGLKKGGSRAETAPERKEAQEGRAESFYQWADAQKGVGALDEAEQKARRAHALGHPRALALAEEIQQLRENPPPPPPAPVVRRWEEPTFQTNREEVAKFLMRGREHFAVGEYEQAASMFKSVLAKDRDNTEAMRLLAKVQQKRLDLETMELDATRRDMVSQVRAAWNPREYIVEDKWQIGGPGTGTGRQADPLRDKILKKLEDIRVPEVEFRQANINDVIEFLRQQSVEFDTTEGISDAERGVNIILNLQTEGGAPGVTAPTGPSDPFAATSLEPAALGMGAQVPLITFSARNISLMEALKIVTKVAGLKYRIEGSIVMVVPFNAPEADIVRRIYDVLSSVSSRITEMGGGGDDGGAVDAFGVRQLGGGGIDSEERTDWKNFFGEMGVKWPEGSKIKYMPTIGKLVVANTPDNLTEFEKVLSLLNVVPTQIEIEARFVEVSQLDLDSLGFEWMLTDDWEIATKQSGLGTPIASQQRIIMEANSAGGGFSRGKRFLTGGVGDEGIPLADDILTVAGVLTNPDLRMVLHALQQRGNTDLLSAPKVVTQSGSDATIKVVTEYIYPTDFTVTPITASDDGGNSSIVGGVVEPSDFETREVGVILNVVPEVSTEGQMITLSMTPEVVSEPTWREYGSTYTAPDGSEQRLTMEQPFFHTRTVSTTISIYNGATVVMGGMITENRQEVNDKVPFLGDIPLIGRLFQSKYERSDKRNLLIFVTARLVDPAGRPVSQARGVLEESI